MDNQNLTGDERFTGSGASELHVITERILKRSGSAISKIEENIELTNSLRQSNSLISQIDAKIDGLTSNLQQYQYFLSQLNSLLIRSEFFEAQLNMLEAHHKLNSLRSSNGMPSLNDWKDKDLNWRTTEATLENLYLEYQYLTKQMEQLSDPQSFNSFIISQHEQQQAQKKEPSQPHTSELPDTMTVEKINLKPIRCVSKTQERQRRRSMDLKKKKFIAQIPSLKIHRTNQQSLPTPETSFDATVTNTFDEDFESQDLLPSPNSTVKESLRSRRNSQTTNKHIRCASLPDSIASSMLDTVRFSLKDDGFSHEMKKDRKFSLRHFISHETGLKTKCLNEEEDDVKDSEFLNSPISIKLESYLEEHIKREKSSKVSEEDVLLEESQQEDFTVFEHKLNRSNSCDSIFSMMKPEPFIPRDNTQQTMNWMKQFAKPQSSYAKESNVTTMSINNLSSSTASPSRQALSNLVAQNTTNVPNAKPLNKLPFLFAAKRSSPLAATTTTTTTMTTASENVTPERVTPSTPKRQLSVDDSSSYHSFESPYSNSQQHKQWSLLLNKFKPKNLIPSHTLVTSEVGRPISRAQPIPIAPTSSNHSQGHHNSRPLGADKIKGSFSTLTIGPNRSRIVQHGEYSTLGQSLVVSSKISHAALRDAIDSDIFFE